MTVLLVASPNGPVMTQPDQTGVLLVDAAAGFGADNSGNPYFDPDGATYGQGAPLALRQDGSVVLVSGAATMFGAFRALDGRLHAPPRIRPGARPETAYAKLRVRTGRVHGAAMIRPDARPETAYASAATCGSAAPQHPNQRRPIGGSG
jgi:hypothetical protein